MIEDQRTGEILPSEVHPVGVEDLETLEPGWAFDWARHVQDFESYKLVATHYPDETLGLMSLERPLGFIEVVLIESNPKDVGGGKRYRGIPGHLLAFAADLSFQQGNDGFVRLIAKTELIDHYIREYGFMRQGRSHIMVMDTIASARLITLFLGTN